MSVLTGVFKEYGPSDKIPTVLIPFKNRYARLVIYGLTMTCTTRAFIGWHALQNIMIDNKAYARLCPEDFDFTGENKYCDEQYDALQNFYLIAYASEFSFSVVAGYMYGHVGPMITGLVGQSIFSVGWLLLTYCNEVYHFNILAAMCLGGAVNLIAYPTLIVKELFPKHSALAMSFVIGCQTAAPIVPVAFQKILKSNPNWTLSNVVWLYIGCVVFPLTVLFVFSLPVTRKTLILANQWAQKKLDSPTELTQPRTQTSDGNCVKDRTSIEKRIEQLSSKSSELDDDELFDFDTDLLKKDLMTLRWWLFALYYTASVMQYAYYASTIWEHAGEEVFDFRAKIFPTYPIWSILFGVAIEYTKTLPMCSFLTSCVILMLTLAYFPTVRWLQYLNQVVYVVSNSYIYTVKYTYCAEQWSPLNFGMLVGLMASLSGVFSLLNLVFQRKLSYLDGITMYLVLACGCFFIPIGLYLCIRKKKKANFTAVVTSTAECVDC